MNSKLKELASLPVGLEVVHTPNPARAQRGGRSGMRYTWLYKTTVRSCSGCVTIDEFGGFSSLFGIWLFGNYTGEPFTPADFAEWYSCPNALVMPGQEYSDPCNWGGGAFLWRTKAKWYFIGSDENGDRVKGEADLVELGELER